MPQIIEQPLWSKEQVVITKGEALMLECVVAGEPQPVIQWYKGEKLAGNLAVNFNLAVTKNLSFAK